MKIKKLSNINNISSYSFFDWDQINIEKGDNPNNQLDVFKKNNVIFGENGNGKSNLIKILKSLNGEDVQLEKNRDRTNEDQKIIVNLGDDSVIQFTGLGWNSDSLKSKFLIFDKNYIEKYVHSLGPNSVDSPERRQQRGKNIVYLGSFTEYNDEINKIYNLRSEINDKNESMLSLEEAKVNGLVENIELDTEELKQQKDYVNKLKPDDLDDKKAQLSKLSEELGKIEKSLKEKDNISKLVPLTEIQTEITLDPKDDPKQAFLFTVASGMQQTLNKIEHKKDFVKEGLSLIPEDGSQCPFCEQKIKNGNYLQIIKDYQDIFDEEFALEERRVNTTLLSYKQVLENLDKIRSPLDNKDRFDSAQQFLGFGITIPGVDLTDDQRSVIKGEIDRIYAKQSKMLNKINDSEFDQIAKVIKAVSEQIKNYNEAIKKINIKLELFKKDSSEGKLEEKKDLTIKDMDVLNKDVFFMENKKQIDNYFEVLDFYKKNNNVLVSLDRIKQSLKTKILEEFNNFVNDYFELIKGYIKKINPSMEILEIQGQATYDQRNPQDPAQCGFRVKYNGEDCTHSLSEGEKQVLALAFFLAQLKKETDKNKIIVLDDPITSFDAGKRKSVAELLNSETGEYEQLFIFTCDPLFREYCLKQITNNRNFYYLFKTLGSSSIHFYKTKDPDIFINLVCDKFEGDFRNIEQANGDDENIIVYGQKLRFCLETKIKENYFGYSQDSLSNMIEQVASRGSGAIQQLISNKDKILEIYKYCNTGGLAHYPRDGSTSWNELKGKVTEYLDLNL